MNISLNLVEDFSLCHWVLHTHLFKECVFVKTNLNNYDGLIYPRKHIQNVKRILDLLTQKSDVMWKVLLMIFYGSARVWYHNLEPNFNFGLYDLYIKLISYINASISAKKSMINHFYIIQREDESTKV